MQAHIVIYSNTTKILADDNRVTPSLNYNSEPELFIIDTDLPSTNSPIGDFIKEINSNNGFLYNRKYDKPNNGNQFYTFYPMASISHIDFY